MYLFLPLIFIICFNIGLIKLTEVPNEDNSSLLNFYYVDESLFTSDVITSPKVIFFLLPPPLSVFFKINFILCFLFKIKSINEEECMIPGAEWMVRNFFFYTLLQLFYVPFPPSDLILYIFVALVLKYHI